MNFRYAICNEIFEGTEHEEACRLAADLGYTGLEIAPFTLAPRITEVKKDRRRTLSLQAKDQGLQIIGLHWLLAKTEGFHLNSPEQSVRQQTADYLAELALCCRELGGDVLVFGSPAQRRRPAGATCQQAMVWAADTFQRAASAFANCGVRLCLEPLSPSETDFINTIEEALDLLAYIDHGNFALHLDVKAMATEATTIPELVHRYGRQAGHFHANDVNRRGPGAGPTDFVPIFQALNESGYAGWISVEVFDFAPDPVTIARESISYMRHCEARLQGSKPGTAAPRI